MGIWVIGHLEHLHLVKVPTDLFCKYNFPGYRLLPWLTSSRNLKIIVIIGLTTSKLKTWKKRTFKSVKHVFTVPSRKTREKLKLVPRQRQYSTSYTEEKQALQATMLSKQHAIQTQNCPRCRPRSLQRCDISSVEQSSKSEKQKQVKTRRGKLRGKKSTEATLDPTPV
jgi:hypothetical protein